PAPPPSQGPKPRRVRRWFRIAGIVAVVVLLLSMFAVVGLGAWLDRSLQRSPVLADYAGRPSSGHGTTWLFVGSDKRDNLTPEEQLEYSTGDESRNGLTDTIMLIHVPSLLSDTPPTVISIPRDSAAEIPGHGTDKINSAFALGGGPLLVQTVEQKTGLRIDHYAEIGFLGVADVVDALGGVPVCLSQPVRDDEYTHIDLPAGCQTLDGRTALGYVRTRAFPNADLQRVQDQREFMTALLHRIASPSVWLNPLRWVSVPRAVTAALIVDKGCHVWDLARLGWALNGSPTKLTVPASPSGDYLEWDKDAATQLFDAVNNDNPIPRRLLEQPGG
ncbi:MAG TPA: LCP family protein, partial [Mycobacterium sp.]|nr:LCP family protein [Mycobacterium sp.]